MSVAWRVFRKFIANDYHDNAEKCKDWRALKAVAAQTAYLNGGCCCLFRCKKLRSLNPNCCRQKCAIKKDAEASFYAVPDLNVRSFSNHYLTCIPGCAPLSGLSRKISFPPGPAAITMPSETPKRILRGARLATIMVKRPSSSFGSG